MDLSPVIRDVGQSGFIPTQIEIRFSEAVVGAPNVALNDRTDVTIKPEVAGRWAFSSQSVLTFTPQVGFQPGTEYLVVLKSVQQAGDPRPIAGTRVFQHVFRTPALTLNSLDLMRWVEKDGHTELSLVFTGPVKVSRPKLAVSWSVDGIRRSYPIAPSGKPNVFTATIKDDGLKPGSVIKARVVPGRVVSAVDADVLVQGTREVSLPKAKAVFIRGVAVTEGADGFFIRVACHDEASTGRRLSYWDNELGQSMRLSPRCVLEDAAAQANIRLEPKVDFTISPTRGGFRIHAPFARGPVELVIEAGARSVDGGVTASRFRRAVNIPPRKPKLEFVAQGRYLPPSAWKSLALRHQNVGEVNLRVRHVTRENIVRWLADSGEGTSYHNSDLILDRTMKLEGEDDVLKMTRLSMSDMIATPPAGLVEISVTDKKWGRTRATVRFAITDLNLLAKRNNDGSVRVWVLQAHDHRPVAGASVELVVYSGREIATCQTDDNGACDLNGVPKGAVDKTSPFALLARTQTDFTFVRFDQLRLDTSGQDVQGVGFEGSSPYRASLYSDRGVYRPGDTAHVAAIIRTKEDVAPPTDMPVTVELLDPKRKVSRRRALKTNEAGMVAIDFTFADFADTGRYQAVFKAGKREIGRYAFSVEEFVPERMEVTATASTTDFAAEDEASINVSARYLFGGSAAGSRFEIRCELAPARFAPKQFADYTFDIWRERSQRTVDLGQVTGTLGAEGASTLACPSLTGRGRMLGTSQLRAQVAVFESGSGRTTNARTSARVHPSSVYIGLKSSTRQIETNKTFEISGVLVDWNGELNPTAADSVEIELLNVEREYGWVYDEIEGRWTNRNHTHLTRSQTLTVPVKDGRFKLELKTPESATSYVIRAKAGDTRGDLTLSGSWGYWWYYDYGYNRDQTPRPLKPESLIVKAPKEIEVGDEVDVAVDVPYKGRLLWTVESDRVHRSVWQDVEPGPAKWSFTVDDFEPNVYVSVVLLKDPHEESKQSFLPLVRTE